MEGPTSALWSELRRVVPPPTYLRFAKYLSITERKVPTWIDLRQRVRAHLEQRRRIGRLQASTETRYKLTLREFETFLAEKEVSLLPDITRLLVEQFKTWRLSRIMRRKHARGGTGLALDIAILHRAFAVAVEDEMIVRNPVRMEERPGRTLNEEQNLLRALSFHACENMRKKTCPHSCSSGGRDFGAPTQYR